MKIATPFMFVTTLLLTGGAIHAHPTETATAPIAFQGGVIIGNVDSETIDERTPINLRGAAGVILPADNPGGTLELTFAAAPESPIDLVLNQFPHTLQPNRIIIDGHAVHIAIAPGQVYQYIEIQVPATIQFSQIIFHPGMALPDPETCDCITIKLADTPALQPDDIQQFLNAP